MCKLLKKMLSVFLVLILVFGCSPFTNEYFSHKVSAADLGYDFSEIKEIVASYKNKADNFNFDEYLATHFTSSPTIDLIEKGMNDDLLVAPGFISDLQSNVIFNAAYGTWEVSTFIGNPGETIEKLLNRELYYETVLFRLLNSSINSENAMDWLTQGAIKHSLEFSQSLTDAADWDYSYDVSHRSYIADLSKEDRAYLNKLAENYVSGQNYTIIGNGLDFIDAAMDVSSSIEEFSGRIGAYLQLANLSQSTIEFLKILKANVSGKSLSKAIDTVLAVSNESFTDFMDAAAKAGAVSLSKTALKSFVESKWKKLLVSKLSGGILSTGYTVVNGILIANSLGQTISNVCFSTSKKLDHYELLKSLVETETAIKDTVRSMLNNGLTSGTMLSTAVDLLYEMYELDCDLCIDLVNIMDGDWIQLSTSAQRNQAKENINTVKDFYSAQYQKLLLKKGTCGDNLGWIFDKISRELIIFGIGSMTDYKKESAPWYEYKDSISNIHISSLCSQIGEYAFYGFSKLGPIVFTDILKNDLVLSEGCFDSLSNNATFIFTEDVDLEGLQDSNDVVVYALGDIYCDGPSYFKEIYVQGCLRSSNILSIAEGGTLIAQTFDSSNITTDRGVHLYLNKNATAEIYGDALFLGREHNPFVEKDFDALTILSGGKLNIYGDVQFCSGVYTTKSGSQVNIIGDCLIGNGGISEPTYFYSYGDLFVNGQLAVEGGYCSNVLLMIYGTATVSDFKTATGAGSAVGAVSLIGDMFITDESVSHDLSTLVMQSSSYLSVKGDAKYINNYRGGTYFTSVGMGPCVGTIELYNDAYFSEPGDSNLNIILSGTEQQMISGYEDSISAGTFTINNTKGVIFDDKVTSLVLFNHKQNPFTLKNSTNTFQDYDKDGKLDNVDPYPLDPMDGTNKTDFVVKMTDCKLIITGYSGNDKHLVIPDSINGYAVASIECNFDSCSFETVTIGANVSNISTTAFNNISTLEEIYVDSKNKTYKSEDGVLFSIDGTKIERYPSGKNDNTFAIPDTVTSISNYAFYKTQLKSVEIPDSVTKIGNYAFRYSAIESITIPENVSSVGMHAFRNCDNLTTVYYNAVDCTSSAILTSSKYIFTDNVQNIVIGEKVKYLPAYFLRDCDITEIVIPNNVIEINNKAFYDCDYLTIKGYVNSYAKEYAEYEGFVFEAITCGNCICDEWQIIADSTCTEQGTKSGVCTVCGAAMSEIIDSKEHSYPDDWTVVSPATCTEDGSESRICTICESATETRTIDKTGHDYVEVVIEPICTNDGSITHTCKSCNDSYSEIIEAIGHIDNDNNKMCDNCQCYLEVNCDHICHKTGFLGFFAKIAIFFWKLFGTNPVCECGVAHY